MDSDRRNKISIGIVNPQGHVRWKNLQIAEHPDTGGQIVYITELAKELEKAGCRVDILTRYFKDPEWPGYGKEIENYNENLRIVRIKCGPDDKFVRKEDLWIIINEFAKGIRNFYKKEGCTPDILTSHYADGGLAAAILKKKMKIPFTHTGHSLGGKKMDNLHLSESNFEMINKNFKFHLRISAERISFRNGHAIITSTDEEIKHQYGHKVYKGAVERSDKFNIIPPGIDPNRFFSYHKQEKNEKTYYKAIQKLKNGLEKSISKNRLNLPCVFSAARFDAKKNPTGMMRAYASSAVLQKNTNLMIIAGNIEEPLNPVNRTKFKEHERLIVEEIINIIKNYQLNGKVCFMPRFDYVTELSYIYRYAGRNRWIFINPALHEPFGLTIVEAMASGVPVVATEYGGPSEILENGKHGILVNPNKIDSMKGGLEKLLPDRTWEKFSIKGLEGIKEKFTWNSTANGYLKLFKRIKKEGLYDKKDYDIPEYFIDSENCNDEKLKKELRELYF